MSNFKTFLHEQMQDPAFRRFWEARNEMILQRTAGSMALSEMELTEEDKVRILRLLEHPEELDAMLEELIQKHISQDEELEDEEEPVIHRNRARCRKCGSILESRSRHDLQTCSCGAVSIDGGLDYLRRLGEPADIEELSE